MMAPFFIRVQRLPDFTEMPKHSWARMVSERLILYRFINVTAIEIISVKAGNKRPKRNINLLLSINKLKNLKKSISDIIITPEFKPFCIPSKVKGLSFIYKNTFSP